MANGQEANGQRIYHIRVEGELDGKRADWFEGFVTASRENGETVLSGAVTDQAALHGILDRLHGLGLPLLLVAQSDCPCPKKNCRRHGQCRECAAHHAAKGALPYCQRAGNRWDKRCTALTGAK
jgi:hypothetical protein